MNKVEELIQELKKLAQISQGAVSNTLGPTSVSRVPTGGSIGMGSIAKPPTTPPIGQTVGNTVMPKTA